MTHIPSSPLSLLLHRLLLLLVCLPLCFQLLVPPHFRIMSCLHRLSLGVELLPIPTFIFSAIFTRNAFSFTPSRGSFSAYNRRISSEPPLLPSLGRSDLRSGPSPGHQTRTCSRAFRAASFPPHYYSIRMKTKSNIGFRSLCSFCASRRS